MAVHPDGGAPIRVRYRLQFMRRQDNAWRSYGLYNDTSAERTVLRSDYGVLLERGDRIRIQRITEEVIDIGDVPA